jgi:hypothetical protein
MAASFLRRPFVLEAARRRGVRRVCDQRVSMHVVAIRKQKTNEMLFLF